MDSKKGHTSPAPLSRVMGKNKKPLLHLVNAVILPVKIY
jgi:hypothetical protein